MEALVIAALIALIGTVTANLIALFRNRQHNNANRYHAETLGKVLELQNDILREISGLRVLIEERLPRR